MKLGNEYLIKNNTIKRYVSDVTKYPILTDAEFSALFVKFKAGDETAKKALINSNLRFVMKVVAKVALKTDVPSEDLISEGNYGLIEALDRFDPARGVKFISFAVWYIRMYIYQAMEHVEPIIKISGTVRKVRTTYNDAVMRLTQKLERDPYPEEIQEELGIRQEVVDQLYFKFTKSRPSELIKLSDRNTGLIDNDFDEQDSFMDLDSVGGLVDGSNSGADDELSSYVDDLLIHLPDRSAKVLIYLFGLRGKEIHSIEQVADIFNLSQEHIKFLKYEAIRAIKAKVV